MASYLPPTQCADGYTDAATIGPNFACDHASVTVGSSSEDTNEVYFQIAQGTLGDWAWSLEREFAAIPETFTVRGIVGIRFRNKVAGQVATVACNLLGPKDPDFGPGTPL